MNNEKTMTSLIGLDILIRKEKYSYIGTVESIDYDHVVLSPGCWIKMITDNDGIKKLLTGGLVTSMVGEKLDKIIVPLAGYTDITIFSSKPDYDQFTFVLY